MKMSDVIENFIRELFEDENSIELKRNELALYFNCVPSQINYVISTRFTTERGYIVESRRGGGGHIKITRVAMSRNDAIRHVLSSIGESLDVMTLEAIIDNLYTSETISADKAKLILSACSNNALSPIVDGALKNRVRASIFKNLLLMFI
ncbi:MAG: CtsR family transcriptional regulator [Clostridia bacterium]|nr:CtsR family transcriptional regulator [Clostridia bacterium]